MRLYKKKIYAPSLNTITYSLYFQCSTSQTQFHLKQLLVSRSSITRKMTRRLNFSHIKVFFQIDFSNDYIIRRTCVFVSDCLGITFQLQSELLFYVKESIGKHRPNFPLLLLHCSQ